MMKTAILACLLLTVLPPGVLSETTTPPMAETTETEPTTATPDMTTETEPTTQPTTMPTTQPPPTTPPLVPYVVKDTSGDVCVVMEANFTVVIPYEATNDQRKEKDFVVSSLNPTVTGDCGELSDVIDIAFNGRWGLSITIGRLNTTEENEYRLELTDVTYFWKELTLKYSLDPDNFPDAAAPTEDPIIVTTVFDDDTTFVGSSVGSYKCASDEDLAIGDGTGITLKTTQLQYRAFGETPDDKFPDTNISECKGPKEDDEDSNTVAIVLGAVFGGLAFIILIVVIGVFCRRSSRRNYEKV